METISRKSSPILAANEAEVVAYRRFDSLFNAHHQDISVPVVRLAGYALIEAREATDKAIADHARQRSSQPQLPV